MESVKVDGPTWIMNPHGIKSCVPKSLAEKRVNTEIGWKYCDPEYVPDEKEYPLCNELNEQGLKRRRAINESKNVIKTSLSESELRQKAKELGIKSTQVKSVSRLIKEVAEVEQQ